MIHVVIENVETMMTLYKQYFKHLSDQKLQMQRAKKFRQYTIDLVKSGQAGLKPISSATRIISGEHDPEFLTGSLLENMEVRSAGTKDAEAGYFDNSAKKVPGKNISYAKLAILQHTGYRIPLTGEKGRKVRAWLAMHGVNLMGGMGATGSKENKWGHQAKWIIVPPRPWMLHSVERYVETNLDIKVVYEYMNKMARNKGIEVS